LLASSSPFHSALRTLPRRALIVSTIVAAAAGFVVLTHENGLGAGGSAVAYAEAVHYSIAPVALGRIDQVLVKVGQPVKRGDPLVTFDGRPLGAAREKAAAELARLEAAVAASMQDQEFQVTRSELWVLKARADERGDRAALAELNARTNRLESLLADQMIPAAQAEQAREKQRELAARVQTFDQAKVRGQAGLGQIGAGNHDHAQAIDVHVEPARRAVEVQRATLRQLDLQIEELTLRAPVDGVVSTIVHRAGEVIDAGGEVLALVSARPGVLQVELSESLAPLVHVGQTVTVRSKELLSHARHGRVIELSPEVDEMLPRARPSPAIASWGRRATVQLDGTGDTLPGQGFHVSFD